MIGEGRETVEWWTSSGLVAYEPAVAFMERHAARIRAGEAAECVWLLEHPPIYTAGTSARAEELLDARFPVYRTGRGGRFTYHGPGQRVAYVMLDLARRGRDVRAFVHALEEWLILTLADVGVRGERRAGRVGIWVALEGGGEGKIAAIGVRLRQWVTFHGVALNVEPDLAHFAGIVPCGLKDYPVVSLAALGIAVDRELVDSRLRQRFEDVFGASTKDAPAPVSCKGAACVPWGTD